MSASVPPHRGEAPSPWVQRWSHLVPAAGTVLDVACGSGRHLAWFADRGHAVTGIDRDIEGAALRVPTATLVAADIENKLWPLHDKGELRTFDAVVVTHYLWRPLLPTLLNSVAPGGLMLYETFMAGNETVGRPSRPDFLLQPGELLSVCAGWHVVAFEQGYLEEPARVIQRIAALRIFTPALTEAMPARYTL